MRFALISLSIYLLIHAVGSALADIDDLEFPDFELEIEPEMGLDFSQGTINPEELRSSDDRSNVFHCDGYLTNNPAENYCSDTVPDNWSAREFNGEIYFLVPLNQDAQLQPLKQNKRYE